MKLVHVKSQLSQIETDIVAVGLFRGEKVTDVLHQLDGRFSDKLAEQVLQHLDNEGFKAKDQEIVSIPTFGMHASQRLYIVGLGDEKSYTHNTTRGAVAAIAKRLKSNKVTASVTFFVRAKSKSVEDKKTKRPRKAAAAVELTGEESDLHLRAVVEGWVLGRFDFDKYKSSATAENGKSKTKKVSEPSIGIAGLHLSTSEFNRAAKEALTISEATNFARALIAEPPVYMTPTRLSLEAKRIAKETDLTCKVLDTVQIEKLGMGSFLGVARGADEPPKFIVMKYTASGAKDTVALVGKGITFDSGGLSLKPAASMERMKYDMSGAAAVIAIMKVVGTLKPKVSVIGVVAATENMPSGKALHPGDVVRAMNGKTIEVNNTDAEGRLVLADALTYVLREKVDEVIDIATLTGAVVSALGRVAAGIMGTDQGLIDRIMESGKTAGEKFWQLPLFDDYKSALLSDVADLKNAGSGGEAGSSCAGMFLKEFVDGTPWAHLDIAGVAWCEKPKGVINKGGTGFGVRTISNYLLSK